MKKSKIIKRLSECVISHALCGVEFKNCESYFENYFPLKVNENFFLGAIEDDFQLDGFRIWPISKISKAKVRKGKRLDIEISEGIVDQLYTPKVNISGWKQIFRSLKDLNRYVMIETDDFMYVGSIIRIKKHSVIIKHFDAEGVWQEEPVKIRFDEIQSVTFGSRYVEVFSKYVPML